MSSYDFYMLVRSLEELVSRLMPLLVVVAGGLLGLFIVRAYVNGPRSEKMREINSRLEALERRIGDLEARK